MDLHQCFLAYNAIITANDALFFIIKNSLVIMKEIIQHAEEISMLKYGIIGGNENALEFIDAADISEKWQLTAAFTETAREMAAIREKHP